MGICLSNLGAALKVNPILGIVAINETLSAAKFAPPPNAFGIEVNADKSALVSATLPTGDQFNFHTGSSGLLSAAGVGIRSGSLLPLTLR